MEMNAKHVLLTHFSQRYPKLPVINKDLEILKKTAIAFDHMEVSLISMLYLLILMDNIKGFLKNCLFVGTV